MNDLQNKYPECFEPHPEFRFESHENERRYFSNKIKSTFVTFARPYGFDLNWKNLDIAHYEAWGFMYCSWHIGIGWRWCLMFELCLDKYITKYSDQIMKGGSYG